MYFNSTFYQICCEVPLDYKPALVQVMVSMEQAQDMTWTNDEPGGRKHICINSALL